MAEDKKRYSFRLLGGHHRENGKSYHKGDVVESDVDLSKLKNGRLPRFELVEDRGK